MPSIYSFEHCWNSQSWWIIFPTNVITVESDSATHTRLGQPHFFPQRLKRALKVWQDRRLPSAEANFNFYFLKKEKKEMSRWNPCCSLSFFVVNKICLHVCCHLSLLYYPGQSNTEYEPDPARNSPLRSFSCQERQVCYYLNASWRWFCFGKTCRRLKQEVALEIFVIFCRLRRVLLTSSQWQSLRRFDKDLGAQRPGSVGLSVRKFGSK